ncbi:MAG TPA: hypothetical protein VMS71_08320, partial [Candidatus Acidoferrum sp.]|nr:hypothetical protein [Candidatus Acidoferrum sp.]
MSARITPAFCNTMRISNGDNARRLFSAALFLTIALFGVASSVKAPAPWGINHLQFLPLVAWLIYWIAFLLAIMLAFATKLDARLDRVVDATAQLIFERGIWPRLALAVISIAIFYAFRMKTHFLGDGYALLSVLGQGETYMHKWTEMGSIEVIRWIQSLLGEHTKQTALETFQILSVFSGGIVIYNFVGIAENIAEDRATRLVALVTLLFSGVVLLFFGYVEFYPTVWAGTALFINLSLESFRSGRRPYLAILVFALTCYLHLMLLFMGGSVLYQLIRGFLPAGIAGRKHAVFFVAGVVGLVLLGIGAVRLYVGAKQFHVIFLPLTPAADSGDYGLFTSKHFLDIVNEILVIVPSILALSVLAFGKQSGRGMQQRDCFLVAAAVGALSFLLFVDPGLGMARDWDLMSLTLLPLILLILSRIDLSSIRANGRLLISLVVVSGLLSTGYLYANISGPFSERRFLSLIEYYGAKDLSGWSSAASYFRDAKNSVGFDEVVRKMKPYFPDEADLAETYNCVDRKDYNRARALAENLVERNPNNTRYLDVLGNTYAKLGEYQKGEACYL